MNSGITVTPSVSPSSTSLFHSKSPNPSIITTAYYPLRLSSRQTSPSSWSQSPRPPFPRICCSSSPRSPGSGESDNKTVLDAFFLGKALGEALTERIESAVGEVLSTIGRLQAEQQKQVQEFQEDVLERAKRAKEKAAREALLEQGRLIPSSTTANEPVTNGASSSASPPSSDSASPVDNQNSPPSSVDEDRTGLITRIQIDE